MKKTLSIFLTAAMLLSLAACGNSAGTATAPNESGAPASESASASSAQSNAPAAREWASTDDAFDPLQESDAITFEDMRAKFGAIPKVSGDLKFAGNVKAFENVVWREIANGYVGLSEAAKAGGINLTVDTTSPQGENDEEGQLTILKDQVRQGVNAILLSPISDGNCLPAVDSAHEANIPVFSVNNEFNGADYFVGPNALSQGELAAAWVNEKLGGSGKVAIVMGMPKTGVTRNRTAGFENWFKANGSAIEVVEKQNADWDRSKAKDIAQTWLKMHPDLKAIFCNNDVMALGVVEAVKEAGLKLNEDIYVVGCDGQSEAYDSIKAGEMAATIDSFPYYEGYMGAEVALRVLAGQDIPKVVWTPCKILDSTNVNNDAATNVGWSDPTFE